MKFNDKLVLNRYILSLLGYDSFEELAKEFDTDILQMLDENDNTVFYNNLVNNISASSKGQLNRDKMQVYDENIVRHTKAMGRDITWKYFQYLSLLFVEIYLDRYFSDKEILLNDLNEYLYDFNQEIIGNNKGKKVKDKATLIDKYKESDLNKLALYNATGSGKTLLMHINLMQVTHYTQKHNIKFNKTILITPNEGLSAQHLKEFEESNISAEIFNKNNRGSFSDSLLLEIIEITKLGEDDGDKTVAVDSFEDNNLVFIDEGHRGSSGDVWKTNRDKLSANGFAFEYSATFAQAINSSTGKKKAELESEYVKSIIFDYSYKYFYNDGYGKDYAILNLTKKKKDEDISDDVKRTYLVASLLSFYQQMKIYETQKKLLKPYLIGKPLMVFVGSSVNAVRTESKRQVSDVVDVLLFIDQFIKNSTESIAAINKIMSLDSGMNRADGSDIFANKFSFLTSLKFNAQSFYDDMLSIIFNGNSGVLHIEDLKGADGEIGLKIGENEYFGVINVGDSTKLTKLCEKNGIQISAKEFNSQLFSTINDEASKLNILIGSKKFSEGWSSWRVSTMGLMNVGKKEGSQIIQLFGRGVRLKGYDFCLKRSRAISGRELDRKYQNIETLNIFGLKADYMKAFKDYLKDEGVPTDERVEFILPLIYDENYKKKKLKVVALQEGKDFKREVKLDLKYCDTNAATRKVELNLYKKVELLESTGRSGNVLELTNYVLTQKYLSFININNLFFALQQFKNEKNWSNLNISKSDIKDLLNRSDWYKLYLPSDDLKIDSFNSLSKFETIMITLLKKYTKSFYEYEKSKWESQFLEYRELDEIKDKANLIDSYAITVDDKEDELIEILKELETKLNANEIPTFDRADLKVFGFDKHLYNPLIYTNKGMTALSTKPVELNEGEKDFVIDLDKYLKNNSSDFELFLLRNQSKTGLSLFVEGNFYPDFIMWIIKDEKQYISFVDPKGIRNLNPQNDPKLNLSKDIKDIEKKLNDEDIILNSFIISNTSLQELKNQHSELDYGFFENKNVLFQEKGNYVQTMIDTIVN